MENWDYERILLSAKKHEARSRKQMEYYLEEIELIKDVIKKQDTNGE